MLFRKITALFALLVAITLTAQAPLASTLDDEPGEVTIATTYATMNATERATFIDVQTDLLTASNLEVREAALQNLVYLAKHYPELVKDQRATMPLYETYRLEQNESLRIMALAGLHAIGSENIMRHLAQDVQLEGSDKVRALTNAALLDYFGSERVN